MFCFKHNARDGLPQIRILNVKPNDSFNYSIVLIRGEIVDNTHSRRNDWTSFVQIVNENIESHIENAQIASDGRFKVAIELAPGVNQLKLRFCCVTHEISLIFNKRSNPRYLLKLFYIICSNHDGHFQAPTGEDNSIERACEKIDLSIRLVQCLYAEMLVKHDFDRKSFEFVGCQPFYSSLSIEEARQMDQSQLWKHHAMEIITQETDTEHRLKYFGILASTLFENGVVKGNAALGIGDMAIFGAGTLYAWPTNFSNIQKCFQDETTVDIDQLMDDSNGRGTFGGCFATALGSLCHEIGHIFNLGHTVDGVMGNDIDYVNRMFTIEKCPRDLPRRMISKCSNDKNPDNKSKQLNPNHLRLTTIKKTNAILTNYHCRRNDDLTFLTENCAILLNFHKWFNQFDENTNQSCIRYDFKRKIIESILPLVLVEFRSKENGMCIKYYRFDVTETNTTTTTTNEPSFHFTIPGEVIEQNYDLIALDKNGNIMKCDGNEFH